MSEDPTSIITTGKEAKEKILSAVSKVSDIVGKTLGPGGKNVLVQQDFRGQRVTNDGVTIADSLVLQDETEQLIARTFVEAAKKTNDKAGDGTSTSIVLARALIEKVLKENDEDLVGSEGSNVMELKRQIDKEKDLIVEEIKKRSEKIKTKEDLIKIASVSLEDEGLGKKVAELVWEVGKDGFVGVEEGFKNEIETESIIGMKFNGKYIDERLSTNNHKEAIYEGEVPVLVTNHHLTLEDWNTIKALLEDLVKKQNKGAMVIFAEKYDADLQNMILKQSLQTPVKVLAVKSPSLVTGEFEDLAIYTDSIFVDKNQNMKFADTKTTHLGKAQRVVVDDDQTILVGGGGSEKSVKDRIKFLKGEAEAEKDLMFKRKVERRIANMASGVGNIKVGATTQAEQRYLKLKLEDAVFASKSALDEGFVEGGGKVLKSIGETLTGLSVLKEMTHAPYDQIQENYGKKLTIPSNVIDPAKVTRTAVENACSIAGMLITTHAIVAERREKRESEVLEDNLPLLKTGN